MAAVPEKLEHLVRLRLLAGVSGPVGGQAKLLHSWEVEV